MKKTFTIILTLMLAIAIALSTSGCTVITEIKKEDHKNRILSMLEEKYGEEFEVLTIDVVNSSGFSGGLISGRPRYKFTCSPVANKEVIFNAATMENDTTMSDDYPHAVIKQLIKEEVETVISKYSDNYAVYVYMSKPDYMPNDMETYEYLKSVAPFTKASDISIKSYNEKYLQTYFASIDIVLCDEKYKSIEATQKILDDNFSSSLYEMDTVFYFYFTNENKVAKIKDILNNSGITPDSKYSAEKYGIDCELVFRYTQDTNYAFKYADNLSEFN
ncbi:MAG: hypothetical protein IJZ51_02205 [Ruminiclostridium sp.]|nr:hypothetical protein [Ruminiclostridium sp.]